MASQLSEDQISILRQAASILRIPISDLPAALKAREGQTNVAETYAKDSGLPFAEHSRSEINEEHHIPVRPLDSLNWDGDAFLELEQALEQRPSTVHFEANTSSLYQGLILPELLHQGSSEALQSILPLDPDSSPRNPALQPSHTISAALNFSRSAGWSNFTEENANVLPDLTQIDSQYINFEDVFDMNAYNRFGELSSTYAPITLLQSAADAAGAFQGPNALMNAFPILVPMSGGSDEVHGSSRDDDLRRVNKLHTLQPPYTPSARDVSLCGNLSSSPSSSGVIITSSSEKERPLESNIVSCNQGIPKALAASGPCRYIWELPKRVRDYSCSYTITLLIYIQGARRNDQTSNQCKRRVDCTTSNAGRRRRPFHDQQAREATALTRRLKACLRCRMQRLRVCLNFYSHIDIATNTTQFYSVTLILKTQTVIA